MKASAIAAIVNGKLTGDDLTVSSFTIDSRALESGQAFIALPGERFDGHDFVTGVAEKGAVLAIVQTPGDYPLPTILVKDCYQALADVACYHRNQFELPVLALTGSCGKTSVKEMVALMLPEPSFATKGNFNNHIGVPLSLLKLESSHRYAVFELGANHIGEIKQTVSWVKPNAALITNIAPAHLEGFGSIEGVLTAKSEIFSGLSENGTAVINVDDPRLKSLVQSLPHSVVTCSVEDKAADVRASEIKEEGNSSAFRLTIAGESQPVKLQVLGLHHVKNAVCAAGLAHAIGLSLAEIVNGLEAFGGVAGRLTEKHSQSGMRIIDDTYNANLHSVRAAIDVLAKYQGKKVFVLGALAEVGEQIHVHYQQIAEHLNKHNIDLLLTCGKVSADDLSGFKNPRFHFDNKDDLLKSFAEEKESSMTILVKGSRSAKMEDVVTELLVQ